jgi:carbon storage regulator
MLVLSRKSRESVVVGGSGGFHRLMKVTVLGIKGTNVKLGFEVDGDVPVHRAEVWERIQAGQRLDCLPDDSVTPGAFDTE